VFDKLLYNNIKVTYKWNGSNIVPTETLARVISQ